MQALWILSGEQLLCLQLSGIIFKQIDWKYGKYYFQGWSLFGECDCHFIWVGEILVKTKTTDIRNSERITVNIVTGGLAFFRLLAAQYYSVSDSLNFVDFVAIILWIIGFSFEAGGDYQMAIFKSNPANKGKVLSTGFWKYTRHPNYFGDATVWWSYGLFAVAAGSFLPLASSLLMTLLIIKVSGVSLLERSLKDTKPEYREYIEKTSSFLPWFPKK